MNPLYDASSTVGLSITNPLTVSHTCTGNNRILMVGILCDGGTITACTYNSVNMTFLDSEVSGPNTLFIYYLVAPATGANTISVTRSGGSLLGITGDSYTRVNQSRPIDANAKTNQTSTSITTSVTTTKAFTTLYGIGSARANLCTAGTNTQKRSALALDNHASWESTGTQASPTGPHSLTFTNSNAEETLLVVALSPLDNGGAFLLNFI